MTPQTEARLREEATHKQNGTKPPLKVLQNKERWHGAAQIKPVNKKQKEFLRFVKKNGTGCLYEYDTDESIANLRNIVRYLVENDLIVMVGKKKTAHSRMPANVYKITEKGRGEV